MWVVTIPVRDRTSRPVPATNFRDGSIELTSFTGGTRLRSNTHHFISLTRLPCTVRVCGFRTDEVSKQRNGRRLGGFSEGQTNDQ